MHDGVFRKRELGKLERELAERLENPEIYDDEQVVQSLARLLDQDCQLDPIFQSENLPNDLWVRETLIEQARAKRLNPYSAGVQRRLECIDWDTASYPTVLEAAMQAEREERLAAKRRFLETKVKPGQTRALRKVMSRFDRAEDKVRASVRAGQSLDTAGGGTPQRPKRLDFDAPIPEARRHAP
jgi:predicted nuclease of restriction endonuclease-like RecB superfamily